VQHIGSGRIMAKSTFPSDMMLEPAQRWCQDLLSRVRHPAQLLLFSKNHSEKGWLGSAYWHDKTISHVATAVLVVDDSPD
jgi:hypothetical protein